MLPSTSTWARPKRAGSRFSRPSTCTASPPWSASREAAAEHAYARAREVQARGVQRRRLGRRSARRCWSTARPTGAGVPVAVAGTRSARQLEVEDQAERTLQLRMRFQGAQGLMEVEGVGIDLDRPGLGLGRRRHVVIGAERAGDVLEGAGIARRRDQPFAVERSVQSARDCVPAALRWRAMARQRRALSRFQWTSRPLRIARRRSRLVIAGPSPRSDSGSIGFAFVRRDRAGRARHRPPGRRP